MTAVAWSALGVLSAAVFGMFAALIAFHGSLMSRIDRLDAKIDALGTRLDARIDALTQRFDAHLRQHAG